MAVLVKDPRGREGRTLTRLFVFILALFVVVIAATCALAAVDLRPLG